jgi:hypothetical protein
MASALLQTAAKGQPVSIKSLSQFTGTVQSAKLALGPRANLSCRSIYDLTKGMHFLACVYLDQLSKDDLFWFSQLPRPSQPFVDPNPTLTIATDATLSMWAGWFFPGLWCPNRDLPKLDEAALPSNVHETGGYFTRPGSYFT